MLYAPKAFEPLTEAPWGEGRVLEAIAEIVADTDEAFDDHDLWPAEDWDSWQTPVPLKSLYVGASGVLWALDALGRRGHAETQLGVARAGRRTYELWHERPDLMQGIQLPEPAESGLLSGGSGLLTVLWRLDPSDEIADELYARVRGNRDNAADEIMWGSPGTMLAARAMLGWTGEERWADAWRESATALLGRRRSDGLWANKVYGEVARRLTPPHGLVGNVQALLNDGELLGAETRTSLVDDTNAALERTAVREDGLASWPTAEERPLEGSDGEIRLQWCAGAPGIVASASSYLEEELLLAGAETIWQAGPHGAEKGGCICHGTAGNGYAFLKVFDRTQDERWLDRARRFAVHALEQVRAGREQRGRGRYSLWTGDVGVALFAADCLDRRTQYPILETWE
ncbi:MAG: LanC-like protein [Actinobacteria bacterium]|nr:LanC-like protein [Actinomycetota bacterium]